MAEEGRNTEQIKVRVDPADALRFRVGAASRGYSLSEYLVALLDAATTGNGLVPPPPRDAIAELSRAANAVYEAQRELADTRANLGRGLGLIKNLFNEASRAAEPHHVELAAAARDLRALIVKSEAALDAWNINSAHVRNDLERAVKAVYSRGA